MGNYISFNDTTTSDSSKKTRIPKHLQPLRRKQAKKNGKSEVNSAKTTPSSQKETPPNNYRLNNQNFFILNQNRHQTLINSDDNMNVIHSIPSNNSLNQPKGKLLTMCVMVSNSNMIVTTIVMETDYPYLIPYSETEINRHRVQYYVIRWAFDSRHIAPPPVYPLLVEGIHVLDVGCGPGLWLGHPILDMAEEYTNSRFESVDICCLIPDSNKINRPKTAENDTVTTNSVKNDSDSTVIPDQHAENMKPPNGYYHTSNFKFTEHNVLQNPLPYPSDTFDYVQQNLTTLTYKKEDWVRVITELMRVTKPGGYIQFIEVDLCPYQLGPVGEEFFMKMFETLHNSHGLELSIAKELDALLTEAGLANVRSQFISVPIGPWGLDIGVLWKQNVESFIDAAKPFLLEAMNINAVEFRLRCKQFMDELNDCCKAFNNIYVVWGQAHTSTLT
ncbi:hypothetical protein BDB01DRAFT_854142 [Pilobolus umbonatus]|nr:hypothetical protein BDB01DRAFT_854142 [Pilobolus umbonatus]